MKEHPLDKAERQDRERRKRELAQQQYDQLQRRRERGEKPDRKYVGKHRKENG